MLICLTGVLNLVRQYYAETIDVVKDKLAGFFCAHHRCENGGLCDIKPLEEILSYRTVLSLPGLQDNALKDVLSNIDMRKQYSEHFDIIPNIPPMGMPRWDWDPYFAFRAIFTTTDLGILRKILRNPSDKVTDQQIRFHESDQPEVVFNGESLAFLGKVLMIITEITEGKLSLSKAADEIVICKCPLQFEGEMCGERQQFNGHGSCFSSFQKL